MRVDGRSGFPRHDIIPRSYLTQVEINLAPCAARYVICGIKSETFSTMWKPCAMHPNSHLPHFPYPFSSHRLAHYHAAADELILVVSGQLGFVNVEANNSITTNVVGPGTVIEQPKAGTHAVWNPTCNTTYYTGIFTAANPVCCTRLVWTYPFCLFLDTCDTHIPIPSTQLTYNV